VGFHPVHQGHLDIQEDQTISLRDLAKYWKQIETHLDNDLSQESPVFKIYGKEYIFGVDIHLKEVKNEITAALST